MRILYKNIGLLAGIERKGRLRLQGSEMSTLEELHDGYLVTEGELIAAFGPMQNVAQEPCDSEVDVQGGAMLPAFCDSHTHIVYAGSREQEFEDKIRGLSYEEVARRGGGILNSADLLHTTPEEELYRTARERALTMIAGGTGSMEIKSGYGLDTGDELKMLRVIARLREELPIPIVATFLGAHAVPRRYGKDADGYVEELCRETIPQVAEQKIAQFIDVFCDRGFFTPAQTARLLECGAACGLIPKIHANELDYSGGVEVGVAHGALSVDHLEHTGEREIAQLKGSRTMPTLLPGASFFSRLPYAPARQMIESGLGLALASDYNPGSTPSGNMSFIHSLGCIQMRLTPTEALAATTLNGAYAMGLSHLTGSITVGKRADLRITKPIPSLAYLPYSFGENLTCHMVIRGKRQ